MVIAVDPIAREIALRRYALPECLHVPVAALDEEAVSTYVGEIVDILAKGSPNRALLVRIENPLSIDTKLPISNVPNVDLLHRQMQVWVHVKYSRYRTAYKKAFPSEEIAGKVLSHTMNRRTAILKGFQYVRITPASRSANSSSGFSEKWGVSLHGAPGQTPEQARRGAKMEYADLCSLMVMLDMQVGGGIMSAVNEGQALVTMRTFGQ